MRKYILLFLVLGFTLVTARPTEGTALLSAGQVTGAVGQNIEVPVQFTADAKKPASTLQFDLILPAGVSSVSITPGPAAKGAEKSASSAVVKDRLRVIVFGVNQVTIPSGVIATMTLNAKKGKPETSLPLTLTNVIVSDAKGKTVPSKSQAGTLSFSSK